MGRLVVELPDSYLEALEREAKTLGVTVEDLVRAMVRERVAASLAGHSELCRCIDIIMRYIDDKRFWSDLYMWLADLRGHECTEEVGDGE